MKRLFIICSVIFLTINSLQAQVNKEVEVTKAYVPTVTKAQKPMLEATITDTAYINPQIDYNITPLAINTQLQTLPIKPATVTYWEYNKPAVAQLKVGAGLPLNSLLQGYISSHNASVGYVAAQVDHQGNYSKIINELDDRVNATQTLNSAALAAGLYLGGHTLGADISYSNDLFNRYAFEQVVSPRVNYQKVGAAMRFGDDFIDLERFNFNLAVGYSHFFDHNSNVNNELQFGAAIGKELGLGKLVLSTEYNGVGGGSLYDNQTISLDASLSRELANWQLLLGAKYFYDKNQISSSSTPHHYIMPQLLIRNSSAAAVCPFAQIGGSITQNSYANLSAINPYLVEAMSADSSVEYNFAAGITGQFASSTISYRLDVAYTIAQNNPFWGLYIIEDAVSADEVYDNYFDIQFSNLNTTSLNLEVDYKPHTNFTLSADAHYYLYNEYDEQAYVNSQPDYKVNFALEYNMQDVEFGLKASVLGQRNFTIISQVLNDTSYDSSIVQLPVAVDVGVYMNWMVKDDMSIFINADNLCNMDQYPWPYYRGFGMQFTAGVKLNFR
ncbi:MAG: hypothetical protein SNF93_03105 [Rikenellaceae bacterium]